MTDPVPNLLAPLRVGGKGGGGRGRKKKEKGGEMLVVLF